ncbi:phytoene/squalene synthase family protein [Candidatus Saccharibacteria bacterium]|nr:phytoene/squalene synthase family protein [Candidatus Saccharibacteria bacterium]
MDLYTRLSHSTARYFTKQYSTSFSLSTQLIAPEYRQAIYDIYGLVRVADEIVDTYKGPAMNELLSELEADVQRGIAIGYSANPIVHAFISTAKIYKLDTSLLAPFFASMRADITKTRFTAEEYTTYIYGSAEVVGLLCLGVFTSQNFSLYQKLIPGARALGAAYQKVNFLRDIASDYHERGRWYFPYGSFETFDETLKQQIITECQADFICAQQAISQLPASSRSAVELSYRYYSALLERLSATSAADIKSGVRVRVPVHTKTAYLGRSLFNFRKKRHTA